MENTYENWLHQRTLTFIATCFTAYMYGTTLLIYFQTEYFYFKDTMKVKYPDLFFGLSWACLCSSGVLSSLAVSYYADKTRNIKRISICVSCLCILGNLMYTLYYSPYIVLTGQVLAGTIAARSVALVGEVSRVYRKDEMTHQISILTVFTTLGGVSGPALTFAFNKVNVRIGDWKLSVGNMPGLYMLCLSCAQLLVDISVLKNTSKNYEKLPSSEQLGDVKISPRIKDLASFTNSYKKAVKTAFSNKPVVMIFILILVTCYARGMTVMLQPVKFHQYLRWHQTDFAKFNLITAVASALPVSIAITYLSKRVSDFTLLIFSLVILILVALTMVLLCYIDNNYSVMQALAYINGSLVYATQTPFHVVSRSLLLKFVPTEIRTVTDALRNTLFELSYALVGASVKLGSDYTTIMLSFLSFVIALFTVWFLCNRECYKQEPEFDGGFDGEASDKLLALDTS